MQQKIRSHCPVTFAVDVIGDKWSLLILRDMILWGKKFYQDFLEAEEAISTNILADRLHKLESSGLIQKQEDPENKKRFIYSPTEKALDFIPVILEIIKWSVKYDPDTNAPMSKVNEIKNNPEQYIKMIRAKFEKA